MPGSSTNTSPLADALTVFNTTAHLFPAFEISPLAETFTSFEESTVVLLDSTAF